MPVPNTIQICLRVSKLWSAQDFGFREDNDITKKKVRVVSLARDTPTGPPFLITIIILSQTVWELRPAQVFGFREDNYITKEVKVVSIARDTLTGPLYFYQTLSKYVYGYQNFGAHKSLASGEITT